MLTKVEKSWVAGFFEGEGSCGTYNRIERGPTGKKYFYKNRVLQVSVCQKYNPILIWIKKKFKFGSLFCTRNPQSFGKLVWSWRTTYKNAEIFLLTIKPYLRVPHKIKQVNKALKLWDKVNHNQECKK